MPGYGQRLRLRLFLEGIEVPIISINVRSAPNSPTACSIQIPPLPEATRFFPRTLVHVFFLDMYEQESPLVRKVEVSTPNKRSPTAHEKNLKEANSSASDPTEGVQSQQQGAKDIDNSRYKLLFGGEVVGFQWTKNSSQRSLVLQCMDWSNYWDYAYQWGDTGIFGPGIKAVFSGGATNLFTDFLSSKGATITRIVSSGRCNSFPKLRGLTAGIIRLIEAIGGSYFPRPVDGAEAGATMKKFAGQNIFFSIAELRLHITHMLAAFEDDPTTAKLLRRQAYGDLFGRALGGLGGQVSIRKSINALTGVMFHETYGQPCPFYKPGVGGTVSGSIRTRFEDDPNFALIAYCGTRAAQGLEDVKQSMVSFEEVTPILRNVSGDVKANNVIRLSQVKKLVDQAMMEARTKKAPQQAQSILSKSARLISAAIPALQKWRPDGPAQLKGTFSTKIDGAIAQLKLLQGLFVNKTKPNQVEPARLNQHILRPDLWFGSPPRCNVLFPEDYDTVSYSRMFLEEPTRFLLKTNDEQFGEDFLFDKFYFAPQAGSLKADKARLNNMLKNDLLEHELFTGILPVFEKMGEFNVFAAKSGTQKNTSKPGLAQRSANFLYFKHRFAARQMQISGKFNPYIAVGFPGLVIDRYVDETVIRTYNELIEKENERRSRTGASSLSSSRVLGTNFLANFTEVSHSVSQAEARGQTEINCSYARQPDESVEFLGTLTDTTQTIRKKQEKAALRATDVAALNAPKLGSIGPMGGKIVNVTDVTTLYARNSSNTSKPLPLFGRTNRQSGGQLKAPRVQVGIPTNVASLGSPDAERLVDDRTAPVVFRAFRVDEEVPRYKREEVDIPAEEYIRPGWYGDCWAPANIGKAYEDFFGIGSITDAQQVRDSSVGSLPVTDDELAKASADSPQSADDPKRLAPALIALDKDTSIQQAVDFLLLTYSFTRLSGADVNQFIRSYTWRPVATLIDMFGTSDLKFDDQGNVVQGFEGFHSRAFGNLDGLEGLVGPDVENILGIKRGSTIAVRADTRRRKYEAVQAYASALLFSKGILG